MQFIVLYICVKVSLFQAATTHRKVSRKKKNSEGPRYHHSPFCANLHYLNTLK